MAHVVLFGIGDTGRLAHHYLTRDSEHEVVAFTATPGPALPATFLGLPVVPFPQLAIRYPPCDFHLFIALGERYPNQARAACYQQAKGAGYRLISYLSSRATLLTEHPIGENCFILEDVTVQPFVRIGNNVTVWSRAIITHDCTIEDHCFLGAGCVLLGHVHVHPRCFIGANATIRHALTLAPESVVGAGALILRDTIDGGVYEAPPALLLPKRSDEITI